MKKNQLGAHILLRSNIYFELIIYNKHHIMYFEITGWYINYKHDLELDISAYASLF